MIAKLDRLFRNLVFVAALTDSDIEFVAVDNLHYLHDNRLTLHILAAVAPAHEGSNPPSPPSVSPNILNQFRIFLTKPVRAYNWSYFRAALAADLCGQWRTICPEQ